MLLVVSQSCRGIEAHTAPTLATNRRQWMAEATMRPLGMLRGYALSAKYVDGMRYRLEMIDAAARP